MTRIFVVTVLTFIIACTELSKIIAAYPEFDENVACRIVTLPWRINLVDTNGNTKCFGDVEIEGCGGFCITSQTPSWNTNFKTSDHSVCEAKTKEEAFVLLEENCVEGVASMRRNISYWKPLECECSKCNSSSSCQAFTQSQPLQFEQKFLHTEEPTTMRLADGKRIVFAEEKKRRGNSLSLKSQSYPTYFDYAQLAEWEDQNEKPSRFASQSYDPRYLAFVQTAGEKDRKANSPSLKSFDRTYLDFVQLAEQKDPSPSTSRSSNPRYRVSVGPSGWNNRRTWLFNSPPSPRYRIFHP